MEAVEIFKKKTKNKKNTPKIKQKTISYVSNMQNKRESVCACATIDP